MIVLKAMPLWTGETVLLRVVPIDPRDMFRGDYVALGYDFSRIPPEGIPELGKPDRSDPRQGTTVFVVLVPEEDGKHWRMSRITTQRPADGTHQKYLRGTIANWDRIRVRHRIVLCSGGRRHEIRGRGQRSKTFGGSGHHCRRSCGAPRPTRGVAARTAGPAYERAGNLRWPSDTTYRVRRLPHAKVKIDGRLDEPEWSRANVERHFIFPWKKAEAPATEFLAFCDDQDLYFAFRVADADIVVLDKLHDKQDAVLEDRVEMFFSRDPQMQDYFGLEIDSRGRVLDYRAKYYRQLDFKWIAKEWRRGRADREGLRGRGADPVDDIGRDGLSAARRRAIEDSLRAISGRIQPRPQRQARGAAGIDPPSGPQARRSSADRGVDKLGRSEDARARFPRALVVGLAGD